MRKHFGSKQVRTIKGLVIGAKYKIYIKNHPSDIVKILSNVKDGNVLVRLLHPCYTNCKSKDKCNNFDSEISLENINILPDKSGNWHQSNYISRR